MANIINQIHQYKPNGNWQQRSTDNITKIIVHHPDYPFSSETAEQRFNRMKNWHLQRDGGTWAGLSYHFGINQDGKIYQLNNLTDITFQAGHSNPFSIGIMVDGCFFTGHSHYNQPTPQQIQSLKELCDYLVNIFPNTDWDDIVGHKDVSATSCPGDLLYSHLPEVRDYIKNSANNPAPKFNKGVEYYTVQKGGWRSEIITEIINAGIWSGYWQDNITKFNELNPKTPSGGWKAGDQIIVSKVTTPIPVLQSTPEEPTEQENPIVEVPEQTPEEIVATKIVDEVENSLAPEETVTKDTRAKAVEIAKLALKEAKKRYKDMSKEDKAKLFDKVKGLFQNKFFKNTIRITRLFKYGSLFAAITSVGLNWNDAVDVLENNSADFLDLLLDLGQVFIDTFVWLFGAVTSFLGEKLLGRKK